MTNRKVIECWVKDMVDAIADSEADGWILDSWQAWNPTPRSAVKVVLMFTKPAAKAKPPIKAKATK